MNDFKKSFFLIQIMTENELDLVYFLKSDVLKGVKKRKERFPSLIT